MKKQEDIALGKRIKEIRSKLNLDQKGFSKKIDSTVSALSNWENGRNKPNDIMLYKIATLGGITVEELLHGKKHTAFSVRNLLAHNQLHSLLLDKVPIFINELINEHHYYFDTQKVIYFEKLYGRAKWVIKDIDLKICNEIIKDLIIDMGEIDKGQWSIVYNNIVYLLNNDIDYFPVVFEYMIELCERVGKENLTLINYMLSSKLGHLRNEVNRILEKPNKDSIRIIKGNKFEEPSQIVDTVDFNTYIEIQNRLIGIYDYIQENIPHI